MADAPRFTGWRKSSLSSGSDNCVEVAFSVDGHTGIRHSKRGSGGPILVFTPAEWAAFVDGVRLGEFEGRNSAMNAPVPLAAPAAQMDTEDSQ